MKKSNKEQMNSGTDVRLLDLVSIGDNVLSLYLVVGVYQKIKFGKRKNKLKLYDVYKLKEVRPKSDDIGSFLSIDSNIVNMKCKAGKSTLKVVSRPVINKKKDEIMYCTGDQELFAIHEDDFEKFVSEFPKIKVENEVDSLIRIIGGLTDGMDYLFGMIKDNESDQPQPDSDVDCDDGHCISGYNGYPEHPESDEEDQMADSLECDNGDTIIYTVNDSNTGTITEFTEKAAWEYLNDYQNMSIKEIQERYGFNKERRYNVKNGICDKLGIDRSSIMRRKKK